MAVSRKDWELTNSRIWLAEIDIKHGLDFPIWNRLPFAVKKLQTKIQKYSLSSSENISSMEVPKSLMWKK